MLPYCKPHYGVSLTIWGLAILGTHSYLAKIQTGLGFSLCAALPISFCPDALSLLSRFSHILASVSILYVLFRGKLLPILRTQVGHGIMSSCSYLLTFGLGLFIFYST